MPPAAPDRGWVAHAVVWWRKPGPYAMTPRSKAVQVVVQVAHRAAVRMAAANVFITMSASYAAAK